MKTTRLMLCVAVLFAATRLSAQILYPNVFDLSVRTHSTGLVNVCQARIGYTDFNPATPLDYQHTALFGLGLRIGSGAGSPVGANFTGYENLTFHTKRPQSGYSHGKIDGYTLLKVDKSGQFDVDAQWFIYKYGYGWDFKTETSRYIPYIYAHLGSSSIRLGDTTYAGMGGRAREFQFGVDFGTTAGLIYSSGAYRLNTLLGYRMINNGEPNNSFFAGAEFAVSGLLAGLLNASETISNSEVSIKYSFNRMDILYRALCYHQLSLQTHFSIPSLFRLGAGPEEEEREY